MRILKTWFTIFGLLLGSLSGLGQSLTLEAVNRLARDNYPLIRQKDIIRQMAGLTIANISKGFLPQFSLTAQATYQSDVTRVDISIPGVHIEPPGRDQYKVAAEVSQLLYDGGQIRQQQNIRELQAAVEDQELEVEFHKLRETVNQVYFGILYLQEQMGQAELVREDLQTGIRQVEARVQNGLALKSAVNTLRAEWLKAGQRFTELRASRKGLVETLGLLINQPLQEDLALEWPAVSQVTEQLLLNLHAADLAEQPLSRPEIRLFSDRERLLEQQQKLITAVNRPKTSLFLQGGYGRPGLNMLKNEFDLFYVGGVRLSWLLAGWYTTRNDRRLLHLNQDKVKTQREVFLLNTRTAIKQQQTEIEKLDQLIAADQEIIDLRSAVTAAAVAQLANGVITANDYLQEVNAEDQARQHLITHKVLLLQAKINYQTILGK